MTQIDDRDKQILQYLADGLTYKEIGEKVFLCEQAVRYRVRIVREFVGASNIPSLISKAYGKGYLNLADLENTE